MKFIARKEPDYFKDFNFNKDNYYKYFERIRPDLIKEFNNKCGYCEGDLNITSLPQIDNFYPKNKYSQEAFKWNNLILCCQVCNIVKMDKFPLDENNMPLLINPSIEEPQEHLTLDINSGLLEGKTEKGKITISTFALNRPELVELRRKSGNLQQIQSSFPNLNIELDRNSIFIAFKDNINKILEVTNKLNEDSSGDNLVAYLLYANVITSLETYLADIFINTIFQNTLYLKKFVETYPKFKGKDNSQKFELSEIFMKYNKIEEIVTDEILGIIYHNLSTVNQMFKDTFTIKFPSDKATIYKAIEIRHDIVHRNGKTKIDKETKASTEHNIGKKEIQELITATTKFVSEINEQMIEL
ncbi:HNH endonuclease family protein [Chryseobacterium arthrosphaerae]|uniref:Uncharacterized protein n=1 Tax=Chryseobacterium arthrosphaerae TaxID=651561 RepID=A0A1B8ZQT4_9FLAO|nr:hypothetical protein [Chryseobacterium arthrosphaerae]OCA73961.1 hypothetical protein BBI00_06255 [Chryseobacterium arthrosphaerae]